MNEQNLKTSTSSHDNEGILDFTDKGGVVSNQIRDKR